MFLGRREADNLQGHLNIKMSSYQYRESHYKSKTVSRPSYLLIEIPIPGEIVFIFRRGLAGFFIIVVSVFSEW